MKALIIGGVGFVGGYLNDHLAKNGIEVFITKLSHEELNNLSICNDHVFTMDIRNKDELLFVLQQTMPDYIFHLAAQSSVTLSWENPELTIEINVIGTIHLLETIRVLRYNPKILIIGSGEEYGYIKTEEIPIQENVLLRPGNPYAASKATQDMIAQIYVRAYDLDIVIVRPFNHIGARQSPIFVVSDFAKQIVEIEKGIREPILYVGNLDAKRDFTDVRDVVRCYLLLMEMGCKGEIYNLGSGKSVSIKDILGKMLLLTTMKIEIKIDEKKMRPSDIPIIEANVEKVNRDTGWKAEIEIEDSIKDILAYWREFMG